MLNNNIFYNNFKQKFDDLLKEYTFFKFMTWFLYCVLSFENKGVC